MKRILSLAIVLTMVLGMMAVPVFAEEVKTVDLNSAIDSVITLEAGTYSWPNDIAGKTLILKAAEDAEVVFEMGEVQPNLNGANITFEGVTFNWAAHGWPYHGLAHCGNLVYKDCIINGTVFLYGESNTFTECDFVVSGDTYNVWTYGSKETTFNDCTFENDGKAIFIYNEGAEVDRVSVDGCTFTSSAAMSDKAAIEIGTTIFGKDITVDITDCEIKGAGYGSETLSGSALVNQKDGDEAAVKVDDKYVTGAMLNDTYYSSVYEALADAKSGDTVDILGNVFYNPTRYPGSSKDTAWSQLNLEGVTVNGNGHEIKTDSINNGVFSLVGSTLNDLTLTAPDSSYIISLWNCGDKGATISNCIFNHYKDTDKDWHAIYTHDDGLSANVVIDGCTFNTNRTVILRSDEEFTNNIINGAKGVTVASTSNATVSGNEFVDNARLNLYEGTTATVEKNIISNIEIDEVEGADLSAANVQNNKLSDSAIQTLESAGVENVESVEPVADVNGKKYFTLKEAIDAATDDAVIKLLSDSTTDTTISIKKSITLDGDGHEINSTASPMLSLGSKANITVMNATLTTSGNVVRYNYVSEGYTHTYKNCKISGGVYGIHYDGGNGQVVIDGCTIDGFNAFGSSLEKVSIKDTTFDAEQSGYAGVNLWGYAVVENVTLVDDGKTTWLDVKTSAEITGGKVIKDGEEIPLDSYLNVAAKINDIYYDTLQEAITAAEDNDTITLLSDITTEGMEIDGKKITIDLNQNTWYLKDINADGTTRFNHKNNADVTYTNGTINVSGAVDSVCFFGSGIYDKSAAVMTFDNVTVEGDGYNSGYAVFYPYDNSNSVLNIKNSTVKLSNEHGTEGGVIKSDAKDVKVNISNSTFILDNVQRGFVASTTTISNSNISFKNMNKTALRNFNGTITDSVITADNVDFGIENDSSYEAKIQILGNTSVKITNSKTKGILVANTDTNIAVAETAELLADSSSIAEGVEVEGQIVSKADIIEVKFVKADVDDAGVDTDRQSDIYNIVLKGGNAETINRLNSADLTFVLTQDNGKLDYEIIDVPNDNITFNPVNNLKNRYEFHFGTKTNVTNDTDEEIIIAQVKISGYGKYDFAVDTAANATNVVHATTISDNIVDTFVPTTNAADAKKGYLDITDNTVTDIEIVVPTQKLTVNVDFPNSVENQNIGYQQMTITITGEDLPEAIVATLGNNGAVTIPELDSKENYAGTVTFDGSKYTVTLNNTLTLNTSYNVEVSGEGYRTARYTVTMTEDKTLDFWNNVKDAKKVIEVGTEADVDLIGKNVTFLAGDIVKDNNINVYDLSAVVSYFGEIKLVESNKTTYAKYDLNRDGKIDSKDVAMVLVSWGN